MKKIILFIIIIMQVIAWAEEKSNSLLSLENLTEYLILHNKDIANSNYEYSCAMLRQQTLNGYFTPGVFISTDFDSFGQKNFFEKNSTVAASLGYEQKIISGTSFKAVTNYSLYTDNIKRDKYIQNPSLSFVFIQSLKPYWLQGKKKDPIREQYALEKKYSYYKYECSKIIAIQNLVEYFFNIKICNTKLKYIQNQINLCNIKLDSLKKMRENGSINVNDEIATEKDILKYSEDLASIKISMENYIRCLQDLFNSVNFNFSDAEINYDGYIQYLKKTVLNEDFFEACIKEKFLMLENNKTIEMQDNSSILKIGITASLKGDKENFFQNLDKYPDGKKILTTISVDLSPWLSSLSKKNSILYEKQFEEYKLEYDFYKNQKRNIVNYYESLISQFEFNLKMVMDLLEQEMEFFKDVKFQYQKGALSELNFIQVNFELKNLKLKKEEAELNLLLYKILLLLNNPILLK